LSIFRAAFYVLLLKCRGYGEHGILWRFPSFHQEIV
jgi:hypothetical protein